MLIIVISTKCLILKKYLNEDLIIKSTLMILISTIKLHNRSDSATQLLHYLPVSGEGYFMDLGILHPKTT